MTTIERRRVIDAPRDVVWDVLTDPDVYAAVAPNLRRVEVLTAPGEGLVRRCVDTDGNVWSETCTRWTPGESFRVAVDVGESEFHRRLFTRFEGEWAVEETPGGCAVTVRFDFDPRYGPFGRLISALLARRAPALLEAIFDGWEAAVAERLRSPDAAATAAGDDDD